MNINTTKSKVPAYVSMTALEKFLNLVYDTGIPTHPDRGFWESILDKSGSTGNHAMSALRTLGALDPDTNNSNPLLYEMISPQTRRLAIAKAIRERYQEIFSLIDLSVTTHNELRLAFETIYPDVSENTLRKAISFLVQASQYSGISVSKSLSAFSRGRTTPPQNEVPKRSMSRNTKASTWNPSVVSQMDIPRLADEIDEHYKLFIDLLKQLPSTHSWSGKRRDKWLQAITASADLLIEVEKEVIQEI